MCGGSGGLGAGPWGSNPDLTKFVRLSGREVLVLVMTAAEEAGPVTLLREWGSEVAHGLGLAQAQSAAHLFCPRVYFAMSSTVCPEVPSTSTPPRSNMWGLVTRLKLL